MNTFATDLLGVALDPFLEDVQAGQILKYIANLTVRSNQPLQFLHPSRGCGRANHPTFHKFGILTWTDSDR
jgi:hypothetical protein